MFAGGILEMLSPSLNFEKPPCSMYSGLVWCIQQKSDSNKLLWSLSRISVSWSHCHWIISVYRKSTPSSKPFTTCNSSLFGGTPSTSKHLQAFLAIFSALFTSELVQVRSSKLKSASRKSIAHKSAARFDGSASARGIRCSSWTTSMMS